MCLDKLKIGDDISVLRGLALTKHFNLDYLTKRIESNFKDYTPFIFDGASCIPDKLLCFLLNIDQKTFTYECALLHDLGYAYGLIGDFDEKEVVDLKFKRDLIKKCGLSEWVAQIFYLFVKHGGAGKFSFSFSWAFGSKS